MSTAAPATDSLAPVVVVSREQLAHHPEGPTRGYAHIGVDDHPPDAPGRLDHEPLLLFAEGEMRPREGFPLHRHQGIENILVILRGRLRHGDHEGNTWVAGAGDICLMSAGEGGEHSEFVEGDAEVHALVIWLRSSRPGAPCRFHRRHIDDAARRDRWVSVACSEGRERTVSMPLQADATVLVTVLSPDATLTHELAPGRRAYLIAVDGGVEINGEGVGPGERVLARGPGTLECFARGGVGDVQLLLVDTAVPSQCGRRERPGVTIG